MYVCMYVCIYIYIYIYTRADARRNASARGGAKHVSIAFRKPRSCKHARYSNTILSNAF